MFISLKNKVATIYEADRQLVGCTEPYFVVALMLCSLRMFAFSSRYSATLMFLILQDYGN